MKLENGEVLFKETSGVYFSETKSRGSLTLTNKRLVYADKEIRLEKIHEAQPEREKGDIMTAVLFLVPGVLLSALLTAGIPDPTGHPVKLGLGILGVALLYGAYAFFRGRTHLKINGFVLFTGHGKHTGLWAIAAEINRTNFRRRDKVDFSKYVPPGEGANA